MRQCLRDIPSARAFARTRVLLILRVSADCGSPCRQGPRPVRTRPPHYGGNGPPMI